MKICAILATYNRRNLTRRILNQLQENFAPQIYLEVLVIDGGSLDGTQEMVKAEFPNTKLIVNQGAYWNQAMRTGIEIALLENYSHILMLNDDVNILPGALSSLFQQIESSGKDEIIVGKCIDPVSKETTYGALKRKSRISKLNFRLLDQSENYGDTFNGNCVLISKTIFEKVGNLSAIFSHSSGDIDLGLRSTSFGVRIFQMKTPFGELPYNREWMTRNKSIRLNNWRSILLDPKGIRANEWLYFCKTHGGFIWPINFILRYVKLIFN
jgi:GT2 family glycosyltransferase